MQHNTLSRCLGTSSSLVWTAILFINLINTYMKYKGRITENDNRKISSFPFKIKLITKQIIKHNDVWGF